MPTLITLHNAHWQVGLLPDTGAAVAFARIFQHGQWLDLMRPTPEADYRNVSACASFPLLPWSNRIRDARFTFRSGHYHLDPTNPQGTAMHGVGRYHGWRIESHTATEVSLTLRSADLMPGANFPWPFSARLIYRLDGRHFRLEITLTNASDAVFPAGFGHHPYFQRTLLDAQDGVSLELPYTHHFALVDAIPQRAPEPIPAAFDYRALRPLPDVQIDANLTGRIASKPVWMVYSRSGVRVAFHSDDIFTNLIFFSPQGKPFFAVEPVTNANDGFNLYEAGIPGTGVFVLEPGDTRHGDMWLELVS
jgi:aldose 1-epimerase